MCHAHATRLMAAPLLWGGRLLVSLDPNALPDGYSARSMREREVLSHPQAAAAANAAVAIGKVRHLLLQVREKLVASYHTTRYVKRATYSSAVLGFTAQTQFLTYSVRRRRLTGRSQRSYHHARRASPPCRSPRGAR